MSTTQVRVRFAPSPTGFLHVGGARTALFNWLFARHEGGVFVLRIEDTDRERSDAAMTDVILDSLRWLGLNWDEGPFHQVDGLERHRADALRLLSTGAAYRCFCTPAQLEARRALGADNVGNFRYDRLCLTTVPADEAERRALAGEPHTIRFQVPAGITTWEDIVHDRIEFDNADIEDFIVLRTDGTPIYNLAVVSDDIDMRITHVIRGDDHISNTPKQILLYQALGSRLPRFAHVPLILGPDGKRLSKRHGATAVGEYRNQGILPAAMMNFLALLGWAPGTDQEVFTSAELIDVFSLDRINKKSAIFDVTKLSWLNGQHISRMSAEDLSAFVIPDLVSRGFATAAELDAMRAWLLALIDLLKVRARAIDDVAAQAEPYFRDHVRYDADAMAKHWKDSHVAEHLQGLLERFARVASWDAPALEHALRDLAAASGVAAGKLIHPLRVALTGQAVSPGIFDVASLLGRERTLSRMQDAIAHLAARPIA
jgi:glutamyl-tRNA synthetase